MPVFAHPYTPSNIAPDVLAELADIPVAVLSDCLERGQTMAGAMNPLARDMRLCGPARTVDCPVGDNSAIRAAIARTHPGEVIVVDAKGFEDTAVFGGLMCLFAKEKGVAGLVINGAVRDSAEIIDEGLAMFARGTCPKRPRKFAEGVIDGVISCAGAVVRSGDIVAGDADGVVVIPADQVEGILVKAREVLAKEGDILETLKSGGSLASLYGAVDVEILG